VTVHNRETVLRLTLNGVLAAGLWLTLFLVPACGDGDDIRALFVSRVQASERVTAKVAYDMTFAGSLVMEGRMTLTQRPPDSRMDITFTTNNQPFSGSTIRLNGVVHVCGSDFPPYREAGCDKDISEGHFLDDAVDGFLGFRDAMAEEGPDPDVTIRKLPNREIAGVQAECFSGSSTKPDQPSTFEFCFSEQGMLLAMKFEAQEVSGSVEATELSMKVTDADFELPYPVQGASPSPSRQAI
jgi:hypothetical protein